MVFSKRRIWIVLVVLIFVKSVNASQPLPSPSLTVEAFSDAILLKWNNPDTSRIISFDIYKERKKIVTLPSNKGGECYYWVCNLKPNQKYQFTVFSKSSRATLSKPTKIKVATTPFVSLAKPLRYEAEDAQLQEVSVLNSQNNFSGKGYVGNFNKQGSSKLSLKINVPQAGRYGLAIRYCTEGSTKYNDVSIYKTVNTIYFPNSSEWNDKQLSDIDLKAGENTLEIKANWGYMYVDYIELRSATPLVAKPAQKMNIGTNFWFLSSWSGEKPFKSDVDWANAYTTKKSIWNNIFLRDVAPFKTLRFMDWGHTNHSTLQTWSQRRLPNDPMNREIEDHISENSPGGLAYEWMIDLCNRNRSDMWVCIPHKADDEFVCRLAKLIKNNLNPNLKCYVEYSNEVWNVAFQQHTYAVKQAEALKLKGGFVDFYVYRSCQIFSLFDQQFSNQAKRIVKVLGGIAGDIEIANNHFKALDSPITNPQHIQINAYAIAPYFGEKVQGDDQYAIHQLHVAIESGMGFFRSIDQLLQSRKVDLISYEGGQHVLNHADMVNKRPEMYEVYQNYCQRVIRPYFKLFMNYALTGIASKGGCWGVKEFTGQPNEEAHKYRALVDEITKMK